MNSSDLLEIIVHSDDVRDTRLKLVKYRGGLRIDLRVYADIAGQRIPTKRGVSLNADTLGNLLAALQAAQVKLVEVSP